MNPKIIKTEAEYFKAIKALEEIDNNPEFEDNPELIRKSELLEKSIELYDKEHFFVEKGNPIEIIKLRMEYMGLKQKDIIPAIGSKGLVSDVLNKKRKLSKKMIRELSKLLSISQEILNTEYELSLTKCKEVKEIPVTEKVNFNLPKKKWGEIENYSNIVFQRRAIVNVMPMINC